MNVLVATRRVSGSMTAAWRAWRSKAAACSFGRAQVPRFGATNALKALAGYGGVVLLSVAILVWVLGLLDSSFDLHVPIVADGDALFVLTCIKGAIDHGWYLHNPALGAPGAMDLHDFPMADTLHYTLIKLLALVVPGTGAVANLYFFLTFPLSALSASWVMRRLGVSWGPAVVASVLFAFLPYHFRRSLWHLFLASYYLIPLALLVAMRLAQGGPILLHRATGDGKLRFILLNRETVTCLVIGLLVGAGGVYYAFFACIFLVVAGLYGSFWHRRSFPLVNAGLLVLLIAAVLLANLWPSLSYTWARGPNPEAVTRPPAESEMWALKVSNLILPAESHRLSAYHWLFHANGCTWGVALGLVGSAGFLMLVVWFCLGGRGRTFEDQPRVMDVLSVLNGAGLLVGTTSGFGFLFSLLVTGLIRCYYRMCIFLAFLALVAAALALDGLVRRLGRSVAGRTVAWALLAAVLAGGVLDQTTASCRPDFAAVADKQHRCAEFVARVEAALPRGAMVFQLPYCPFPEAAEANLIEPYEHLRPYLCSRGDVHWSFAAFKGRETDLWQRYVTAQPPADMVRTLALAGFSGLTLNRTGYADRGTALEATLTGILATPPVTSAEGDLLFFSMKEYNARLKREIPAAEWDSRCRRALNVMTCVWGPGFSVEEGDRPDRWRWCSASGELYLVNTGPLPQAATLEMSFSTGSPKPAHLWIDSALLAAQLNVQLGRRTELKRTITIPPGMHLLRLRCDAEKLDLPKAARIMVFRVHNFELRTNEDRETTNQAEAAPPQSNRQTR